MEQEDLASALGALRPSETLVPDRLFADEVVAALALKAAGGVLQPMAAALAEPQPAEARLLRLYGVGTLDGFGALRPGGGGRPWPDRRLYRDHPGRPQRRR